jgi:hypothetical protein
MNKAHALKKIVRLEIKNTSACIFSNMSCEEFFTYITGILGKISSYFQMFSFLFQEIYSGALYVCCEFE